MSVLPSVRLQFTHLTRFITAQSDNSAMTMELEHPTHLSCGSLRKFCEVHQRHSQRWLSELFQLHSSCHHLLIVLASHVVAVVWSVSIENASLEPGYAIE